MNWPFDSIRQRISVSILVLTVGIGAALGASPPPTLHYQGVLRDAADVPRNGDFDMVFRFFDAATAGNELLVDRHLAVNLQPVTVGNGLFDVTLGSGELLDGSGPGVYASLTDVVAGHGDVWMAIQIGAETLAPRVRVHSAPFALNAERLSGMTAGSFLDGSDTPQTKSGALVILGNNSISFNGLEAYGPGSGGYFSSTPGNNGRAWLGGNGYGVWGQGQNYGGVFQSLSGNSETRLAEDDRGVNAYGTEYGGFLSDGNSYAWIGYLGEGVSASGTAAGGYFQTQNGTARATLAEGHVGVAGSGSGIGGSFVETDTGSFAFLGKDGSGIEATGSYLGGNFTHSTGSAHAWLAASTLGAFVGGNDAGGFFYDINSTGLAWVGYGNRGIWAKGSFAGGTFSAPDDVSYWADVSTPTRKIVGTGTVSWVQNHPHDDTKVIVYAAPEGDEVATYTRGSGRLADGVARIDLGPTFPLVTNPEYGLTAHLTPRDEAVVLVAESLTGSELVVRGPVGSSASFDYMVYGLRLGFEDAGVIVPKSKEAVPPATETFVAERGGLDPAASATAGARFRTLAASLGRSASASPGEAAALRAAIDASASRQLGRVDPDEDRRLPVPDGRPAAFEPVRRDREIRAGRTESDERPAASTATIPTLVSPAVVAPRVAVGPGVRAGDALAVDPAEPWRLVAVGLAMDPTVVGIAACDPEPGDDGAEQVELATSGLIRAHVDAGYGEITVGDLLVASPTPGHLMRSDTIRPGTVVAKALEPWTAGCGEIRVLVMPR